jgi:GntR family transcriptional regulator
MKSGIYFKKGISVYFQIKEDIISRINSGEWAVGAKIPTEVELVAFYGVSRMTLRKALDELTDEHVLHRERGIGTFVVQRQIVRNQEHLVSLTEEMESQGRTVRSVFVINEVTDLPNVAQTFKQTEPTIHHLQRIRYVDKEALLIDDSYLPLAIAEQANISELAENESLFVRLESNGITLLYGEKDIRAIVATQELAKALSCRPGYPLLYVKTLIHDKRGLPVLLSELYIRSDLYSIKISSQRV